MVEDRKGKKKLHYRRCNFVVSTFYFVCSSTFTFVVVVVLALAPVLPPSFTVATPVPFVFWGLGLLLWLLSDADERLEYEE